MTRWTERPNNTPAQVREYLTDALAIVAELEVDGDLRGLVFTKAVELLSGKQIIMEQLAPAMMNAPVLGKH